HRICLLITGCLTERQPACFRLPGLKKWNLSEVSSQVDFFQIFVLSFLARFSSLLFGAGVKSASCPYPCGFTPGDFFPLFVSVYLFSPIFCHTTFHPDTVQNKFFRY